MATTFDVIFLGTAVDIDPTEGNSASEDASALVGNTYGSSIAPLSDQIASFSPGSTGYGSGSATQYDTDNSASTDTFQIDGRADQTLDGYAVYAATITYLDGTTASISAVVVQDSSGNLYLVPHSTYTSDQAALEAKPIRSLTLDSLTTNDGNLDADRYDASFDASDGIVDGTSGDDSMGVGYSDSAGSDIDGAHGDDNVVQGGAGNDTIQSGAGADTVSGDSGDDVIDGGIGNDSLVGGTGNDSLTGGAGDDVIGGFFATEAGEDYIDGASGDDVLAGGDGSDTILGGTGADRMYGNAESDLFIIEDDFGADTIAGGETGTDLDRIDASALGSAVDVQLTGAEAGTLDDGNDTLSFSEIEAFTLTDFADTLDNSSQVASVNADGGAGNDTLTGGSGADTLIGSAGNDRLRGWNGADSIDGGSGDDSMTADAGDDTVIGGAGNDTIGLWTGNDSVDAGDDADEIQVYSLDNDTIVGGEGGDDDDTLKAFVSDAITVTYSGDEAGTIHDGTDTLTFSEIENLVLTGQNDTLNGALDSAGIYAEGRAGNDVMTGGSGNDTFLGGDGSDTILGGTGADQMYGDAESDLFIIEDDFGADTIAGGETGTDLDRIDASALGSAVAVTLSGAEEGTLTDGTYTLSFSEVEAFTLTDLADSLDNTGQIASVSVEGGAGDDTLTGGTVSDTLIGGAGNDRLRGWGGSDRIEGGAGQDTIYDNAGDDTVIGGTGNDVIDLGTGNDSVDGGDDADSITVYSLDNDTIVGGEGGDDNDTLKISVSDPVSVVFSGDEAGTVTDGTNTLAFSEIEALTLSIYDDSLDGGSDSAGIYAEGRAGNDVMTGGSGNDTLLGGTDNDTIAGGDGDDYIEGGAGDDRLSTGAGQDTLIGGAGNDTLTNSSGDDSLVGGSGDDSIVATFGNDTLEGGDGNDTLEGGADDDLLTGGDGDDVFVYNPGDGNDTITDFNFGNSGTLDDSIGSNNDFIDLSDFYDDIWELQGDQADDGILNQSNATDINGNAIDYSDNTAMNGSLTFTGASADGTSFTNENTGVVCFTKGTAIRTPYGDRLIETLRVGDLVTTMDNGPQRIRWIGRRYLDHSALTTQPKLRPILIPKGVLGCTRDLLVSPQHGMLLGRDRLVRATHLVEAPKSRVRVADGRKCVTYIHLMFDAHQIIFAENAPSESFYPGVMAERLVDTAAFAEFRALFAVKSAAEVDKGAIVSRYGETARPFLARKSVPERFRHLAQATG